MPGISLPDELYLGPKLSRRLFTVVLLTAAIKSLFYFLDPLPQFYGGDSFSYLHTRIGDWIPADRSFIYGLLIGVIQRWSHSLAPLIVMQVACSFAACIALYYCAHAILGISHGVSLALAALFAADPMQLLYERQIMTETISMSLFIAMLTLAFSYLKRPSAWKCMLIPFFGVLSTAFRFTFFPLTWLLCASTPVIVWVKCWRTRNDPAPESPGIWRDTRRLAGHLLMSMTFLLVLLSLYSRVYGYLRDFEPAVAYRQGAFMLAGMWSAVIPEDAPDPRLAAVIATNHASSSGMDPIWARNGQIFAAQGIVARWDRVEIEGPSSLHDELARRTVFNAFKRAPFQVLKLTALNYVRYFDDMRWHVFDLYDSGNPLQDDQRQWLKEHFGLTVTRDWKARLTPTKWLLVQCRWWCYVLLVSPWLGFIVAVVIRKSEQFIFIAILTIVSVLVFAPACVFLIDHARYLHPLGFGTLLIIGSLTAPAAGFVRKIH